MMGWRDLIVSSKPCEGAPDKPAEGHFVYFVDSVSKYQNKSSLSIEDSARNSTSSNPSTEYTEPPLANVEGDSPIAPIRPGWLVAYRDPQGRLRGGSDERDQGTVAKVTWVHGSWTVWLTNGQALSLSMVRSVGKTNAEGRVITAWTTRDCGYNGENKLSGIS